MAHLSSTVLYDRTQSEIIGAKILFCSIVLLNCFNFNKTCYYMNLLYTSCRGIMPYMKNQLQWISRTVLVKENNIEEAMKVSGTCGSVDLE